ncbi:helix-turn-helix transcriptional regulator [Brevibacillus brevis]|uniref:helix-turn-helix domain-containing protein n=1 Tax=Brevibacillus brevis TaxID=1393 RepID=UPI0007D8C920|nr:helix-turn-helix transcriptional regulator [Brevibacillus brevis]WGV62490.1 helix-turn-helix transcriptional regulator [Brevibacillus brevis]
MEVSRFGELSPTSGAEILSELIDKRGSRRAFAEEIGLPPTTLQSMLSRGVGRASIDNVIKVCRALGITVDELDNMASNRAIDVHTIAAHHDGDDWTEEELEEIERFKEFVKLKRKQQE